MMLPKYLGILAGLLLLCGCTNFAVYDYNAAPGAMVRLREPGTGKASVAVLPFADQRGLAQLEAAAAGKQGEIPAPPGDGGSFYYGLIPLMPFGFVTMAEPDKSEDFVTMRRFHFDPSQDLAASASESLRNSGLFSRVIRANSTADSDADYVFAGYLENSKYSGKQLTYCVTLLAAPAFWLLGAPDGVSWNDLGVRFELIRRSTGEKVWSGRFRGSDCIVHWIYARNAKDCSLYAGLMKQAMNAALIQMQNHLDK